MKRVLKALSVLALATMVACSSAQPVTFRNYSTLPESASKVSMDISSEISANEIVYALEGDIPSITTKPRIPNAGWKRLPIAVEDPFSPWLGHISDNGGRVLAGVPSTLVDDIINQPPLVKMPFSEVRPWVNGSTYEFLYNLWVNANDISNGKRHAFMTELSKLTGREVKYRLDALNALSEALNDGRIPVIDEYGNLRLLNAKSTVVVGMPSSQLNRIVLRNGVLIDVSHLPKSNIFVLFDESTGMFGVSRFPVNYIDHNFARHFPEIYNWRAFMEGIRNGEDVFSIINRMLGKYTIISSSGDEIFTNYLIKSGKVHYLLTTRQMVGRELPIRFLKIDPLLTSGTTGPNILSSVLKVSWLAIPEIVLMHAAAVDAQSVSAPLLHGEVRTIEGIPAVLRDYAVVFPESNFMALEAVPVADGEAELWPPSIFDSLVRPYYNLSYVNPFRNLGRTEELDKGIRSHASWIIIPFIPSESVFVYNPSYRVIRNSLFPPICLAKGDNGCQLWAIEAGTYSYGSKGLEFESYLGPSCEISTYGKSPNNIYEVLRKVNLSYMEFYDIKTRWSDYEDYSRIEISCQADGMVPASP